MTIEDLENAVAKLPPDDLARFRAWFEEFNARAFGQKVERNARAANSTTLRRSGHRRSAPGAAPAAKTLSRYTFGVMRKRPGHP